MTDPFDELRTHVRAVALLERPTTTPDDLIAMVTDANPSAPVTVLQARRRRRWLAAGGAVAIVVAGSAGVAAFRGERPDAQIPDVICRSTDRLDSSSLAVDAGSDPIGACAALWSTGQLPDVDRATGTGAVPRLAACTGAGRSLEVYPLPIGAGCADLGLLDADPSFAADDPVAALQQRIIETINSESCLSAPDAVAAAASLLDELGLSSWAVTEPREAVGCAAISVDVDASTLVVRANPFPAPSIQETP
jgi:hypothetical protein